MLDPIEQQLLDRVDQLTAEIVSALQTMIRYPTITPEIGSKAVGEAFTAHQRWITGFLEDLGFETEAWDVDAASLEDAPGRGLYPERDMSGMPVVVGRRAGSGGGRSLLLNGHYDVVPSGDPAAWKFPPFSGQIEAGRIYGRGAADMKGGIAAILFALRALQTCGIPLAGDLTVQIVPDEEVTCMGTLACCLKGYSADAAIIPEPTDMQILIAMRGSVYGTITVPGRAGHAEMAQSDWREGGAVNAISKAVGVIQALDLLAESWRTDPDRIHPYTGPDAIVQTVISGGNWDVTYPDAVQIRFGAFFAPGHQNPGEEIRTVLAAVSSRDPWLKSNPVQLQFSCHNYGAEVSAEEDIVRVAQEVLSDYGLEPRLRGFGSLTDAVHLLNVAAIPTISIGPAMQTIHAVDENIAVEELVETTKLLALLILRWCGQVSRNT